MFGRSAYLPDDYSGVDRAPESALYECPRGHVWKTRVHYEYGGVDVETSECPICDMDGERSDADDTCDVATRGRCSKCGVWVSLDDLNDVDVCIDCETP